MSNLAEQTEQPCDLARGSGAVELIIRPRDKDLGGFSVRRVLPTIGRKAIGPWIFFDHMGPAQFGAGQGMNVRPHPHINLATVTYLFEGEILHRDSLGNVQAIHPGDINLMVAGRGIVHSERERPEATTTARRMHGLQLWLALPEADEEMDPLFAHYGAVDLPTVSVEGVPVRVMMGSAYGVTSPVPVFARTLYLEADMEAGQKITLPVAEHRAVYVVNGGLRVHDREISEHSMAVFSDADGIVLQAERPSRIAVIGGEGLGPRYIDWNFVSSRKDRIEQARQDWKAGRFPKVPGDEQEFIPLPE